MSVITRGNFPASQKQIAKDWFGRFYDTYPRLYNDLFDTETSNDAYEEFVEASGFGLAPIKPENEQLSYDSEQQKVTTRFTHAAVALGYQVSHEEMADNKYDKLVKTRGQALARSMAETKETLGANIYNRAETAGYVGGDGKTLLATDHPTDSGGQSNRLAVNADLSEASLEDLLIQISNAKNGRGLRINLKGKSLHVPTALQFEATRIMSSVLQNDTANNAINAIKSLGMLPEGVKVNPYLTDSDAWFVRTDTPGMLLLQRENLDFDEDQNFDAYAMKFRAYERYVFKWYDWRAVYGSTGA